MKTNKELTLDAVDELIEKYAHPKGHSFVKVSSCPLCTIHLIGLSHESDGTCNGCPLCGYDFIYGCVDGDTGSPALHKMEGEYTGAAQYAYNIRRDFWKLVKPMLKKINKKYFTKKGYDAKAFDKIIKLNATH